MFRYTNNSPITGEYLDKLETIRSVNARFYENKLAVVSFTQSNRVLVGRSRSLALSGEMNNSFHSARLRARGYREAERMTVQSSSFTKYASNCFLPAWRIFIANNDAQDVEVRNIFLSKLRIYKNIPRV